MRRRQHDVRRETDLARDGLRERADLHARLAQRQEEAPRQAELFNHAPVPLARMAAHELGGGAVRVVRNALSREAELEVVRHHQELVRLLQPFRMLALHGDELADRVERLAGEPRLLVKFGGRDDLVDHVVGTGRAAVAVTDRLADRLARLVHEDEIDAPRVDADGRGNFAKFLALFQAREDGGEKRLDIPAERSVRVRLHAVREAEDLLQNELAVLYGAEDVASRGRADVDREMVGHGFTCSRRRSRRRRRGGSGCRARGRPSSASRRPSIRPSGCRRTS